MKIYFSIIFIYYILNILKEFNNNFLNIKTYMHKNNNNNIQFLYLNILNNFNNFLNIKTYQSLYIFNFQINNPVLL